MYFFFPVDLLINIIKMGLPMPNAWLREGIICIFLKVIIEFKYYYFFVITFS